MTAAAWLLKESPMKSAEELNALKEEVKDLRSKLASLSDEELSEDELTRVTGGSIPDIPGLGFIGEAPVNDIIKKYKSELME